MHRLPSPVSQRLPLLGALLVALAVVGAPTPGHALQISYDIVLTAASGPTGSGSFVYDDAQGRVLDFQITLDDFGPFSPVGICDGCAFDFSDVATSNLFDLPTRDTLLAQLSVGFQGGAIQLLLNADGSYGEFNGRADGRYAFVRSGGGEQAIPEPTAALVFAVGLGVVGAAGRGRLVRR